MKITIDKQVAEAIDQALGPILSLCTESAREMRRAGASETEIEEELYAALAACPGPLDPDATAYVFGKLKAAIAPRPDEKVLR